MIAKILPITAEDFDELYYIESQAHLIPWSIGTLKNSQGDRYINLKLVIEGKICGFIICQTVLNEATLFNIAISPKNQGKGYAKLLLNTLINKLNDKKVLTLWLEVRESNSRAKQLYDSFGFNEVGIRKNYYPTDNGKEDAIMMALII